jgi:hypothetical protein
MPTGLEVYTLVHVMLSVFGIAAGFVVVGGFIAGLRFVRWVDFFLATTLLTNLTGFGFPFTTLQPAHLVGAVGSFVLLGAIAAAYWKRFEGGWNRAFVVLSVVALYLNVFVLVTQLLEKIPALAALAPSPQTPVFAAMQGLILLLFIVLGRAAVRGMAGMGGAASVKVVL